MDFMQKIIPNLWFNNQAEEAVHFYTSLFDDSSIGDIAHYDQASAEVSGQPEGSVLTVEYKLAGFNFVALNGGDQFKTNPSISFFVACQTREEVDRLWESLIDGGKSLMPVDKYPFAERYGWLEDRYGVSWQLMLVEEEKIEQKIVPALMFVGDQAGKAEEAIKFYVSLFEDSAMGGIMRYEAGEEPDQEGTIKHAQFTLAGIKFMAMDSAQKHDFQFSEAISLMVNCEDQQEVDRFWESFTKDGEESVCGWLKDKYGVSWQIVPRRLDEMLKASDKAKASRAMEAMLKMKKIDLAKLEAAYSGK
jgi:predicted 3-demethylubiquinone-9 3-methyltransferase (glyoxalase superfamily)